MKPRRIILIRHGESEGNVDRNVYSQKPDYALNLSAKGEEQAQAAGHKLVEIIGNEGWLGHLTPGLKTQFYVSPLFRTRQTFEQIVKAFPDKEHIKWKEDPRLREQEWGHLKSVEECAAIDEARDAYGPFYYRIPDGESAADAYDRVSDFFSTMYRDFDKNNFPENAVIITHGMTIRLFLMRWFHYSVEQFENLKNPENCKIVVLDRTDATGHLQHKYTLRTEMTLDPPTHKYQRPVNIHYEKAQQVAPL